MITGKDYEIHRGDAAETIYAMQAKSIQCVVTSPPYIGLRSYLPPGHPNKDKEIGSEATLAGYLDSMVNVFRAIRHVLRDDGCVWLNLGDSYAGGGGYSPNAPSNQTGSKQSTQRYAQAGDPQPKGALTVRKDTPIFKTKDLMMVPHRVAIALQEDGWWVRADIVWNKTSCMPESILDRPTRSHEYLFLLAKSERYYYDAAAIAEDAIHTGRVVKATDPNTAKNAQTGNLTALGFTTHDSLVGSTRNKRDVWTLGPEPWNGDSVGMGDSDHFAVMPTALVEPCVLASTSPKVCEYCGTSWKRVLGREKHPSRDMEAQRARDAERTGRTDGHVSGPSGMMDATFTVGWEPLCHCAGNTGTGQAKVLDPFTGSGTVGVVSIRHGRYFVGVDLHEDYARMAARRIDGERNAGNVIKGAAVKVIDGQIPLFDDMRP